MAVVADTPCPRRELAWASEKQIVEVYTYEGGPRLIALLHVDVEGGTMLLNRRVVSAEGRRVAMGWALGVCETGRPGWHVIYGERVR